MVFFFSPLDTFTMSGLKSPAPTLAQLQSSLKRLQIALDPLLAQSLESLTDTIEQVHSSNGKLQSAQIHVSMAYVVLDLVWILLKVSGVDPTSHPVTSDLVRVQEYLQKVHKISNRSNQDKEEKEAQEKAGPVDTAKVGRFLRHALGTAASGKRTVFAEDGTVEKVVDASSAGKKMDQDEEREDEEEEEEESPQSENSSSKKAKRQALQAEKALRKASEAMTLSRKKHGKR